MKRGRERERERERMWVRGEEGIYKLEGDDGRGRSPRVNLVKPFSAISNCTYERPRRLAGEGWRVEDFRALSYTEAKNDLQSLKAFSPYFPWNNVTRNARAESNEIPAEFHYFCNFNSNFKVILKCNTTRMKFSRAKCRAGFWIFRPSV